ncbi:MAG TPA: hypothetical protein VHM48_12180 [Candidatus Limnocylindrales bacterium]|nr:hypothetical protein [Candidatus Limnocylindrales bacterium]
MNTYESDASIESSRIHADDVEQSFLEVHGIEGSILRATRLGLTVYPSRSSAWAADGDRRWSYEQLREVRLDAYGPVGVIRATVRSGGLLPLLLLEPEQIAAARRTLEIIWNLMASAHHTRRS